MRRRPSYRVQSFQERRIPRIVALHDFFFVGGPITRSWMYTCARSFGNEQKKKKKKRRCERVHLCFQLDSTVCVCVCLFVTSTTDALPPRRKHFCRRILERERARYIILFPTTSLFWGGGIQIFVSKTIEGKLGSIISIGG